MRYPFTVSEESISVFFSGAMRSIPSTDPGFEKLSQHLKSDEHDYATIEAIIDKPKMISRLTEGQVTVVGDTVYHRGSPVHTTLANKLVYLLGAGFDARPWARFMDRVMENPSERSRSCLFDFLSVWDAPIDDDGYFIAFKRVTENYKDMYTGTFDNSPGAYVSMPREKVNDNPDVKCSNGLHVAASSYLGHYRSGHGRVVACKVSPADVVAVPGDYKFAKMRVCAYTVIGDALESFVNGAHTERLYSPDPDKVQEPVLEEDGYSCANCGSAEVDFDGEWCDACEGEEEMEWQERCDAFNDAVDEADHIAETGLTRAGESVDPNGGYYGAGHNVGRFTEGDDPEPSEMSFTRAGTTYLASQILAGVSTHGQRGYQRITGVPRSTLQEWLKKIGNEASRKNDAELAKDGFVF